MDVYKVTVIPEDDWYAAEIVGPRLQLSNGSTATEAQSFAALEDEVRDIIVLMTDRESDMPYDEAVRDFNLEWDFSRLPHKVAQPLAEYLALKAQRNELEKRYLAIEKLAAIGLVDVLHASHRDTAAFLGLSHSRVAQVLKGRSIRQKVFSDKEQCLEAPGAAGER